MAAGAIWLDSRPLLLASTSFVRRQLFDAAGIPVETESSDLDERAFEAALDPSGRVPGRLATMLARAKGQAVSSRRPGRLVVGADQVLEIDGVASGKAPDAAAARDLLARLAGRKHILWSAAALVRDGAVVDESCARAELSMRALDEASIARYVSLAGDAATRSAGCYEIEGLGIHLFEHVAGDHSAILGLPMLPLLAALRRLGLLDV